MNEDRQPRRDGHRLFYALWPEPGLRQALARATERAMSLVPGQRVPPGNFHVTLAFLGMVPGRALADLIAVGGRGPWPRVELDFEGIEYWPKPKVLVAVAAEVPLAGLRVIDRLWQSLKLLGFRRESRPWQPHLTLVRHVGRPPPVGLELRLSSRPARDPGAWKLALVESVTHPEGARYKPLADWPL